MSVASYEAVSQRQTQATNAANVRQQIAQVLAERSDRRVQGATKSGLIDYGHDGKRSSTGAKGLLLDVLA